MGCSTSRGDGGPRGQALTREMAKELTAEALSARVAARDEAALAELYDRLAPGLMGLILRILPQRPAAEQVLESVFVRFWNAARRLRHQEASVAAWLFIMARTVAVHRRRAERKLPPLRRGKPDWLEKSQAWLPCPGDIALVDGRRDLLKKVIAQLPQPQRGALELALFEGYTEVEIAEKLGEPLGRVKSTLRAGMRFLRHRMRAVLRTWSTNI